MQDNETATWQAREDDGRVLETGAHGYTGAQASLDDGRPAAEIEQEILAGIQARDALADAEEERFADYWSAEGPNWDAAARERDWEAEAGLR
jgi:hypothetical protein